MVLSPTWLEQDIFYKAHLEMNISVACPDGTDIYDKTQSSYQSWQ